MNRLGLVGLMLISLPTGDVRLCDGGFQVWGSDTFVSADAVLGPIGSLQALSEGVGDEVPALELTFLPPGSSEPGDLSQPGFQQSPVKLWIAEYDLDTHAIIGTPDLVFWGMLDRTQLTVGRDTRELAVSVVALCERLFELNIGNSLTDRWHQSVWPGELGHINATGLTIPVAWGAGAPATSPTVSGAGTPGTGGTAYSPGLGKDIPTQGALDYGYA